MNIPATILDVVKTFATNQMVFSKCHEYSWKILDDVKIYPMDLMVTFLLSKNILISYEES